MIFYHHHWGPFKFHQDLFPSSPFRWLSLPCLRARELCFQEEQELCHNPPFNPPSVSYRVLYVTVEFLSMSWKRSCHNKPIGTFPNNCWIVVKILALKELEIDTFGGKSFSYTFFHNSIGERAWNFPMSLSGTGGDPKIGRFAPITALIKTFKLYQ